MVSGREMDLQASACFGAGRDSWVEAIIGVDVEVANDVETPADNATVGVSLENQRRR